MKRNIPYPWTGGLAAWLALSAAAPAADTARPVDVSTLRPARGEIVRYITLPGSIRARQQATIYAKVAGYLKSLSVDKGDRVQAGQVLGSIEVPELIADLARYKAELVRAEAEVKVADLEAARLAQAQKKAPDLVIPQAVDSAEGRLAMARAAVEMARANLDRTEILLRYAQITAPFAGIVTARFVDPGAFIPAATSGSAAQTAAIVTLADFNIVRAQVAVPETEAALAQVGQPVKVTVEGLTGKAFAGKISRMSYALDDATRTMLVESDLPNDDLALRPGMYASIQLGLEKHSDVLLVPASVLVMEKLNAFTFIQDRGRAKKVLLRAGFNDGVNVEVLDGLKGDETILFAGKGTLADGMMVNEVEAK